MYIRYNNIKYFVPIKVKNYKGKEVPILLPGAMGNYVKVTEWLGNRPFRVKKCCEDLTVVVSEFLRAEFCNVMIEGKQITPPMDGKQAIQLLMKQDSIEFIIPVEMQEDVLCHTEPGFKEELIHKVVTDNWRQFKIGAYKVVGCESPSTLFIQLSLVFRTKI